MVVSNQTNHTCHITSTQMRDYFLPIWFFPSLSPHWFIICWGKWRKLPRKVLYKRTFGAPDQGQMLDVWESQTTESALGWQMRHIATGHILELTLEVIFELTLEVILEHVLGIKTMTSLILDHIATAYLYLGINTGEKVMILFLVIVLDMSQDWSLSTKHARQSFFCRSFLSLIISILVSQPLLLNYSHDTCCLNLAHFFNLGHLLEVGQQV